METVLNHPQLKWPVRVRLTFDDILFRHVLAITLLTERYFHIPTECGRVVMWFFFPATLLSYFPKVYIWVKLQAIATAVGDGTTLNDRHGGLGKYGHALVGVYGVSSPETQIILELTLLGGR